MPTIEQMRDQVRRLNRQYKADLESENPEDESRRLLEVFSSPYPKEKNIFLSLDESDFELITYILNLSIKQRRAEYTIKNEEELDSGIIKYEYLARKAQQKSVVIVKKTNRRLIINCIKNQLNKSNIESLKLIDKLNGIN